MSHNLFGRIKNGVVTFDRVVADVVKRSEGKEVYCQIDPKNKRSLKQNSYLWGVVYRMVAEKTGYSEQEVHQLFGQRYLGYTKVDPHGKVISFIRSSTDLDKLEMTQYISLIKEYCHNSMALDHMIIPDPE